jgi:dTDP-4-amino-4,6-dideoxygalactose transaminase
MLPRGKLDIGWADLLFGIWSCIRPGSRQTAQRQVEAAWDASSGTLASLSMRSGFDALLQTLAWPPGTEILTSALTIRDMVRIVEHHHLVPVPIDLQMASLSISPGAFERAITRKTRAILVAHVFGSRMPLDDIVAIAKRHGLLVIEDCAQAYVGTDYRGHAGSDVCMFSFGPIKTNTALGGAVLQFNDGTLMEKVRAIQATYPVQSRWRFLRRLGKYAGLKFLTIPWVFGAFVALCRALGKNHDAVIGGAVRGFAGPEFFANIRRQPSYPLLRLLARRLRTFDPARIERRIASANTAIGLLPETDRPGCRAGHHSHWIFPIQSPSPDDLMKHLWHHGFDATRGASSLAVVEPPADRPETRPDEAGRAMEGVLYLPVYPDLSEADLRRLALAVTSFQTNEQVTLASATPVGGMADARSRGTA